MTSGGVSLKSFTTWQWLLRGMIAIIGIIFAWDEIGAVLSALWHLLIFKAPFPEDAQFALREILLTLVATFLVYLFFIFWLVLFVLPITSARQLLPAFHRIFIHGISGGRWHGPAVFVRNGDVDGEREEFKKSRPGVAFLDLRSAMALDKYRDPEDEEFSKPSAPPERVHFSLFGTKAYKAQVRVVGPGLAFIDKHEKITGSVDLRTQNRLRAEVIADTRDGIRVKTSVSAVFTVGQPPDILDVCVGGKNKDEVFVIEWDKKAEAGTKRISKLSRELHPEDIKEILQFAQTSDLVSTLISDLPPEKQPYAFDPKRVENAIYLITRLNESTQSAMKRWHDWPQDVAIEKFRILLSQYPFMNLYAPDESTINTMKELRREIFLAVRNTGVLAYRLVRPLKNGTIKEGDEFQEQGLVLFPPQTLRRHDVLRDRGIKVINASCGELEPMDKSIREQMIESWVEAKKKDENIKRADYELEATRVINHARVRAQQSMNYHLAKLLEKQEYPREALAILIFQELEAAAANPETRRLLPENTLSIMQGIGQLLMPTQKDSDESGGTKSIPSTDSPQQ